MRKLLMLSFCALLSCSVKGGGGGGASGYSSRFGLADPEQIHTWSDLDLGDYFHGSMCTEFIPERVLWALERTYPDLFPNGDLTGFGAMGEGEETLPIGFSRVEVEHNAGEMSWGINCAVCHTAAVTANEDAKPKMILGPAGTFNVRDFLGAVLVAIERTSKPENMKKFFKNFLHVGEPTNRVIIEDCFEREWTKRRAAIEAAIAADPFGAGSGLHELTRGALDYKAIQLFHGEDLTPTVKTLLRLFHNMRTSVGVPDRPLEADPQTVPGPGRTDAFGVLARSLLGDLSPTNAPVKYGVIWGLDKRAWVHWDGNNNNPLGRNAGAILGLGCPSDKHLHYEHLVRQTQLSEAIRAPKYPWKVDKGAASRGKKHYETHCASCHEGPQDDSKLYEQEKVGTDPNRLRGFKPEHEKGFNDWLMKQQIAGYTPSPWVRRTNKYWAASMDGVWARAPYLHNGSVRTMKDLLTAPSRRPSTWRRGGVLYDMKAMGYADAGEFVFDTSKAGNSAAGHDYGTSLTDDEKQDLIEYLKER